MEILIEILLEIYMECMFLIIPEGKRGKKHYIWAKIIAVVCTLGILALGVWGLVWVIDARNPWGWLPLGAAILLSVLQIGLGIALVIKKYKK